MSSAICTSDRLIFIIATFLSWLDALPKGVPLVLNGDVIDEPGRALPDAHRAVLERLVRESQSRPVIWVHGNRDDQFKLTDSGQIRFVDSWRLERRLLVIHGHRLDRLMPRHSAFKWVFRRLHRFPYLARRARCPRGRVR